MRIFKRIDFAIQLIALIVGIYCAATYYNLFYAYCIVGAVQLTSAMICLFTEPNRSNGRKFYEKALLWLVIITIIFLLFTLIAPYAFLIAAFGWLIITPFYALYYIGTCMNEL